MSFEKINSFICDNNIDCRAEKDYSLSACSSFRIGGACDIALFPTTAEALVKTVGFLIENKIKYTVIGNASNVLFADSGYRGAILFTTDMKTVTEGNGLLICDCGTMLAAIAQGCVRKGYSGYAFACGIPGSIGGAVYMNAGAYEGTISNILVWSEYYNPDDGKIYRINNEEHEYAYRHSFYMDNNYIILRAAFKLETAKNPQDELELMNDHIKQRNLKQPLEYPSAGSVFKRYPGYYTGQIIQESGLKGYSVGGAQVSEKHAGFIINKGGATARDVLDLIEYIQQVIFENYGIHLECEIRYIQ